jgi:hypothetical protein
MDAQDQNSATKNTYPKEFAHIGMKVQGALAKIRQFDERINNMPNDKGPELSYNPPGFMKSRQIGSRDQMINSLEKAKTQLKTEIWQEIDQDLKGNNSALSKQVRDMACEEIYPNIYNSLDETQKKGEKGKSKDIEQSQDFMAAILTSSKEKQIEKEQNNYTDKHSIDKQGRDIDQSQDNMLVMTADFQHKSKESMPQIDGPKEQTSTESISQRFSQSLSYTKTLETPAKEIAPAKDKDGPDRD